MELSGQNSEMAQEVRVSLRPLRDFRGWLSTVLSDDANPVSTVLSDDAKRVSGSVDRLMDGKGDDVFKEEYLDMLSSLLCDMNGCTLGGYFDHFMKQAVDAFREANGQPYYVIDKWDVILHEKNALFDKLFSEVWYLPNGKVSRKWFYAMYHMVKQFDYPEDILKRFEDATADAIYESVVEEVGFDSPLFGVFAAGMTLDEALTMLGAPTDLCGKSPNTLEFRVEWRRLVEALAVRFEEEFGYNPLEKRESPPKQLFPSAGVADWGSEGDNPVNTSPFTQTQTPFSNATLSPFGPSAQSPFGNAMLSPFGGSELSNPFSAQPSMAYIPKRMSWHFFNFGNIMPSLTFVVESTLTE